MAPVLAAARRSVGEIVTAQARRTPGRVAIAQGELHRTYAELDARVSRAVGTLTGLGVGLGDRIAVLSENCAEYLELLLAAAKIGATLACQNVRLTAGELRDCLDLVEPKLILASPGMAPKLDAATAGKTPVIAFGAEWERQLASVESGMAAQAEIDPEAPLLILYTGGTTGTPKGAVLSHRAEIARLSANGWDLGIRPGATNLAWPPFYHMGGMEPALHTLMTGGKVIVEPRFDADRIAAHLAVERFDWVSVLPGAVGALVAAIERAGVAPLGVGACGAMADLVPPDDLCRLTSLLSAPFCNTFGSTETGTPPLSAGRIPPGARDPDLAKLPSPLVDIRLVDEKGREVPDGEIGELAMRGPTLFSGYWRNAAATAQDSRGGWFHMGDLFRRRADGKYEFIDRAKYMIKSGGENIYPAEIERVLMSVAGVGEAVVVKRKDARWGETPVALVGLTDHAVTEATLRERCRAELAGYKQLKEILFVPPERLARTPTGKIPRADLERWLASGPS
jgi:fatty-acyl-CoA synthase